MFTFIYDYISENDTYIFKGQEVRVVTVFDNKNGVAYCLIKWKEKQDDGSFIDMETYITLQALKFCCGLI